MLKKYGDEAEWLVHTPQPIELHGFDGIAKRHDPRLSVLLSGSIHDITTAKFVAHPSDEAEMIEHLPAGCWVHRCLLQKGAYINTRKLLHSARGHAESQIPQPHPQD